MLGITRQATVRATDGGRRTPVIRRAPGGAVRARAMKTETVGRVSSSTGSITPVTGEIAGAESAHDEEVGRLHPEHRAPLSLGQPSGHPTHEVSAPFSLKRPIETLVLDAALHAREDTRGCGHVIALGASTCGGEEP